MSIVYKAVISAADKVVPRGLRPLWEHPAGKLLNFKLTCPSTNFCMVNKFYRYLYNFIFTGPKTIFFWAPAFKWVTLNLTLICKMCNFSLNYNDT